MTGRAQPTSCSRRRSSWRPGSAVTPPWTGLGWRTVERGALRKPNRWVSGSAAGRRRSGGRRRRPSTKASDSQTWSTSIRGSRATQPVAVDVPGDVEEVGHLAVQHHADVDELLAVHARDAPEHDVLVGQLLLGHAARREPLAWRRGGRCRKSTYAARTASAGPRRRGPARASRPAPVPGPRRRPRGRAGRAARRPRSGSSAACSRKTWSSALQACAREPRGVARLPRPSRGGSRARRRGRSPTGCRATAAGWGCARSGRRWRRTRPARASAPGRRAPRPGRGRRSRTSRAGSPRPG